MMLGIADMRLNQFNPPAGKLRQLVLDLAHCVRSRPLGSAAVLVAALLLHTYSRVTARLNTCIAKP